MKVFAQRFSQGPDLMKRVFLPIAALSLTITSSVAHAIPCQEVANMLNAGVPANIVASAIRDSGARYTASDISCLSQAGAPGVVLEVARTMTAAPAAPAPAPAAAPAPRQRGIDSESDLLGSRASQPRELEDSGGDRSSAAEGPSPAAIKEAVRLMRNNKPLSSSLRFYDLLKSGNYPDQDTKIKYYLARSLEMLEMHHTAQYFFLKVVNEGPNTPYFKYALPKLVKMSRYTGDETELLKVAPRVPAEAYPRGSKNKMYYLMGLRQFSQKDLNGARKYFGQISSKSGLYLRARYLEGIIYNKQGKLKSSKRAFMDVVRHPIEAANKVDLDRQQALKDLALVNIGRMYYKIERFDDASKYFDLVPHDSVYWPDSLFSGAWANFMQNNLNHTLGQLLTIRSPFFSEADFIPEIEYLRALTYFNLCEYKQVENILLNFEGRMRPVQNELKGFVKGYASKEQLKMAERAWETYFGPRAVETQVPKALFNKLLRNDDISGIVSHLGVLDTELDLIDRQKPQWRDTVGALLKKVIEKDRLKLKRRAGKFMLAEMAGWANTLQDLLSSSEIVRFEVIDAQRVDYQYKFQNPDLSNLASKVDLDFATAVEFIYWPFNGEFWQDELGYYHYTEQGSCK
jgi:tetratricopeptide (TPR) repeat protein